MNRHTTGDRNDEATVSMTARAPTPMRWARRLLAAALAFALAPPLAGFADANPANDSGSFAIRFTATDTYPPVKITDLVGTAGGVAGQVLLEWTAPQENEGLTPSNTPVSSYDLRRATFSIADVGNSTSAWFNAASSITTPVPTPPSSLQASLTSLEVATTYYFAIRSRDDAGLDSDLDTKALGIASQVAVGVKGIAGVTNLTAATGAGSGEIDLSWTAPGVIGAFPPLFYDFRVSSQTNILDDAAFSLAPPLTALSSSTVPGAGSPGDAHAFTVTGLLPAATYYFAVRETDSGVPYAGVWLSSDTLGVNAFNFARAGWTPNLPDSITNLSAIPGVNAGSIALSWTAPQNSNGVPIERYLIRINTTSIFDVAGDTTAWWNRADSTSVAVVDGALPGSTLAYELNGLNAGLEYFAGIVSIDSVGEISDLDTGALTVAGQARVFPRPSPPIINLTATPGTASGSIALEWTVPNSQGLIDPRLYEIVASSVANINNDFEFAAAQPLSAFSQSAIPETGVSGSIQNFTVTGLNPSTTFYFAMHIRDSNAPPVVSVWTRDLGQNINVNNFSAPNFIANPPEAITDLTALTGSSRGEVQLAWTAPLNQNFIPISSYTIYAATFSVASFAGNTGAWEAAASSAVFSPASVPGAVEAYVFTGLDAGAVHYFAVHSIDEFGELSPADTFTQNGFAQVNAAAQGVGDVKDLFAEGGEPAGSIDLSWTAPQRAGTVDPLSYEIRASSTANIADDSEFAAAQPLSAFSGTPTPNFTIPGFATALRVTGLSPFTTYYFAIKVADSSTTVNAGVWLRDAALARNATNFANPTFIARPPVPVSDLTALTGSSAGRVELAWTAPLNLNFVPISSYTVAFATFPIADLSGDATAWFALASSQIAVSPAQAPGALETLSLTGLEPGAEYFFAVKSFDVIGEASPVDDRAATDKLNDPARARAYGVARVTDLVVVTNGGSGAVDLSWTAPHRAGTLDPLSYLIKVSSAANIDSDSAFAAAAPLSSLSASLIPAVGTGGAAEALNVTGLTPFTTYYFAIKVEDSSAPVVNVGVWERRAGLAENQENFAAASFFPNPPDPITDLSALQGTLEGDVSLVWTAPRNANLIPITHYEIRYTSVSVAAAPFLGNTTAWFDAAASSAVIVSPAQLPGALETTTISGLFPDATFYFSIKAIDALLEIGAIDSKTAAGVQASTTPLNTQPGTPSGLAVVEGRLRVHLGWAELAAGPGGKGLDFNFYKVERSTDDAIFVPITTTTGLLIEDVPLKAFTTYYYRVSAVDIGGLESAPSPSIAAVPVTLLPMEPFGIFFERDGSSITMHWAETTLFNDETEFINNPPTDDELIGYKVERSTNECVDFSTVAQLGLGATVYAELDLGLAYFYRITSYNQYFQSTSPIVLAPFGDQLLLTEDCVSLVQLPEDMQSLLIDPSGDPALNIRIKRRTIYTENEGTALNTVEFVPMRGGQVPIADFALPRPVKVKLRYDAAPDGTPVKVSGLGVSGGASQAKGVAMAANGGYAPAASGLGLAASGSAKHLGVFWNNGKEYKKQYGTVNTADQTIAVMTPNLGKFQVRTQLRQNGATFDLSNITTRVITPNGDGRNDVTIMIFDNPKGTSVSGRIYDLRGAFVADMAAGPQPDSLQWDGKMNGTVVTSGVYVYQVKGDGKTFNGTFVVAR